MVIKMSNTSKLNKLTKQEIAGEYFDIFNDDIYQGEKLTKVQMIDIFKNLVSINQICY